MSQVLEYQRPKTTRTDVLLRAVGIRKVFLMGESTVEVLKRVDFSVRAGEFVAIEGRSGSGKSTFLHVLGALESVDDGTVEFNGADYTSRIPAGSKPLLTRISMWLFRGWLATIPLVLIVSIASLLLHKSQPEWGSGLWIAAKWIRYLGTVACAAWLVVLLVRWIRNHIREAPLTRLRNEKFGFVFQFYHLLPEMNVLENTMLTPMIGGSRTADDNRHARRERAKALLTELGMAHRLKHRPAQLSGGERQRVAIARALMNDPKILFADEPTGNLDAETGQQIMGVFERLHRERGQTIVMVTHDRSLAKRADRILVLKSGKLEKPPDVVADAAVEK